MGHSQSVNVRDVARLLRLAGETGELRDSTARRQHMMLGLRELIGGHSALFFQMHRYRPGGGFATPESVQFEGFDHDGAQRQQAYLVDGLHLDINAPVMIGLPQKIVTCRRRRLLDDAAWYASDHYQHVRRACGIDDQLYSKIHLADGSMIGVGLQREASDKPFTDRDCKLVDLFHEQVADFYLPRKTDPLPKPPTAEDRMRDLPPRYRPVARRLLEGDSSKQVALALGLTRHTVHEYIKQMHRLLQVSNRGELLAKLNPPA